MAQNLPTHIGFIVDGNRRWARAHNLPTFEGHRRGAKKVEMVIENILKLGVPYASFYLFSTENWNRDAKEIEHLMDLIRQQITRLVKKLYDNDIKCVILGNATHVAPDILKKLREAEDLTKDCRHGTVGICFNYGGQQEIVDAANAAAQTGKITVESINQHLYHPEVPPCDLIVRTSGEERLSGFMLWRAAYSEFLFLKKPFPDITKTDLQKILTEYAQRQRRFGH